MKIFLCFRRDGEGNARLFHAYDEFEAKAASLARCTPPSLAKALNEIEFRPGEQWGSVRIDTDDKIIVVPFTESMESIDFDKLIKPDTVPQEICSLCQGDACEEGCGRGGKRPCRRPNDGPDSHRVCTGCGGKGRR